MPHPNETKYQGVPEAVPRAAADACWEFMEELDRLIAELEEIGKLVANARLTADPSEWERRLTDGSKRLDNVPSVVTIIRNRVRQMQAQGPKL